MSATIQIGWSDKRTPLDTDITPAQVVDSEAVQRALRHYAVDAGGRNARRAGFRLARQLKRIAALLPDGHIQIHTTNQCTAPAPFSRDGIALELRYVRDHRIQWDIALRVSGNDHDFRENDRGIRYSDHYHWSLTGELHTLRSASRADALIRSIERVSDAKRRQERAGARKKAQARVAASDAATQALEAELARILGNDGEGTDWIVRDGNSVEASFATADKLQTVQPDKWRCNVLGMSSEVLVRDNRHPLSHIGVVTPDIERGAVK